MVKMLPTIKLGKSEYFSDGRLLQLRDVKNPHNYIDCEDSTIGAMVCRVDLVIDRDTGKIVAMGKPESEYHKPMEVDFTKLYNKKVNR